MLIEEISCQFVGRDSIECNSTKFTFVFRQCFFQRKKYQSLLFIWIKRHHLQYQHDDCQFPDPTSTNVDNKTKQQIHHIYISARRVPYPNSNIYKYKWHYQQQIQKKKSDHSRLFSSSLIYRSENTEKYRRWTSDIQNQSNTCWQEGLYIVQ